jgi:uncharacterized repeat protein (TIGR01451 family)
VAKTMRSWLTRAVSIVVVMSVLSPALVYFGGQAGASGEWTAALTASTPPIPTGDTLSYSYELQCSTPTGCGTITATLAAPPGWSAAAGAPTVSVPLPTGVTYVANPDGSLVVTWANPPVAQSDQMQLNWPTADYTSTPGAQPVTGNATDGTTSQPLSASDSLTGTPNPTLTKSAASQITPGNNLIYSISASNTISNPTPAQGGLDMTDVTITDPLPAGVTYVPGSCTASEPATATCSETGGTVTWVIPGNFGGTNGFQGTVTVAVPASATVGTVLTNTATVSGDPIGSSTPSTSQGSASTTVVAPGTGGGTGANASKTGPADVMPGENFNYVLELTNSGTGTATGTITDTIAAPFDLQQLTFGSGSGVGDGDGTISIAVVYSDGSTGNFTNTSNEITISSHGRDDRDLRPSVRDYQRRANCAHRSTNQVGHTGHARRPKCHAHVASHRDERPFLTAHRTIGAPDN